MARSQERLTLKEMAERFEVTPRTLRHYEYIELLTPEREGRRRYFTSREIARMKLILRGRRFGFSLEQIRQWLNMYDLRDNQATQFKELLVHADSQIDLLERQREELAEAIEELRELKSYSLQKLKEQGEDA